MFTTIYLPKLCNLILSTFENPHPDPHASPPMHTLYGTSEYGCDTVSAVAWLLAGESPFTVY